VRTCSAAAASDDRVLLWVAHLVGGDAIHAKEEGAAVDTELQQAALRAGSNSQTRDMDSDHTLSPTKICDFVL
jgi:hypothetical protein